MRTKKDIVALTDDKLSNDACYIFDSPIVVTNELLLRCELKNGTYIPTEIISMQKLVYYLENCRCGGKGYGNHMENAETSVDSMTLSIEDQMNNGDTIPYRHSPVRKKSSSDKSSNPSSILLTFSPKTESKRFTTRCMVDRKKLQSKYEEQVNWIKQDQDYVSMETMNSLDEFRVLLDIIIKCGLPIALTIRRNKDGGLTILYQLIKNFRKEFMVLPLGDKHCLFLEPF